MVTGIIGKKIGMTQLFDKEGLVQPATVIKAGPCVVVQAKTVDSDGYETEHPGLVERHHFRGGAATHGSMFHRAPGSIGASSFPSRVVKGMRAAGRMGGDRVTVRNLRVLQADAEEQLLVVEGRGP